MLAAGPMCVGDLAAQLPVTRPAVSQHLKVLKDAGLVGEEAVGTRRIYRLDAAGAAALREQLDLPRVPTNPRARKSPPYSFRCGCVGSGGLFREPAGTIQGHH
jgi:hypothetical protein